MKRFRNDSRQSRAGFTLVELFLVLVIIGFAMAVIFPVMAGAMSGGKLQSATRMVVMAGRHARAMAVLKQKVMNVEFDLDGSKVSVTSEDGGVEFSRDLWDLTMVKIVEVRMGEENAQTEGKCVVPYENNGTCTPYVLQLSDARGQETTVEVDPLASVRAIRK